MAVQYIRHDRRRHSRRRSTEHSERRRVGIRTIDTLNAQHRPPSTTESFREIRCQDSEIPRISQRARVQFRASVSMRDDVLRNHCLPRAHARHLHPLPPDLVCYHCGHWREYVRRPIWCFLRSANSGLVRSFDHLLSGVVYRQRKHGVSSQRYFPVAGHRLIVVFRGVIVLMWFASFIQMYFLLRWPRYLIGWLVILITE